MKPFRVGLCQLEAHDLTDAEAALQEILQALDEAGEAGAQLVGMETLALLSVAGAIEKVLELS